ncbi:hypothetical protein GALMADRAFT_1226231 [Galerina marginata CBS 339.88]|uniref:Uncharacterized protein n=1 Tax=Galerina marginata (strain CBS 339.88) TaxID=685588 RepID=A0A067T7Q7_GALM3|nr:hypothetical protein GALMADRAFT_1226231 [Galerina marginata CBS 339.88]
MRPKFLSGISLAHFFHHPLANIHWHSKMPSHLRPVPHHRRHAERRGRVLYYFDQFGRHAQ